jgi:spermidine/putrescine transport system permease protein
VLRGYATVIYLFLYAPIALIVLFSFNSGNNASDFQHFAVLWYGKAANNTFVIEALENSAIVASTSASLATIMGTMAALALQQVRGPLRLAFDGLTYVSIMVPGIVIGISTLIALVTVFGILNPALVAIWPGDAASAPQLAMGYSSIIAGMDRSLIEASMDLYADPWATFRQVTLPQLMPAIVAGFLLSFTFSLDDFVIAFFVAGSVTTLPIYVFSSIRRGVTPEINVIGTSVMLFSLTVLFSAQFLLRRGQKGKPQR